MAAKILNVDEAKLVRAAGGVVRRNGSRGALRVAVVHRPGYDDWSFPKGKVDRGETLEETALREVEEETGLRSVSGAELHQRQMADLGMYLGGIGAQNLHFCTVWIVLRQGTNLLV